MLNFREWLRRCSEGVEDAQNLHEIAINHNPPPDASWPNGGSPDESHPRQWKHKDIPTVTDEFGPEMADLKHVKAYIEKLAGNHPGEGQNFTVWSYDGAFFRNCFTVQVPNTMLSTVGKVMQHWTEKGASPHQCKAVFVTLPGDKLVRLIRKDGRDMAGRGVEFEHDSFNQNPGNDQSFLRSLPRLLSDL